MDITDLQKSIREMADDEIMEAIRLLRHSRTTEDVVRVVQKKAKEKKEDDMLAKLVKLAGGQAELEKLLASLS